MASEFASWSPYSYGFNNPIRFIDPDGRAAVDANCCPGDGPTPTLAGIFYEMYQGARAGLFNMEMRVVEFFGGGDSNTSTRMRTNFNADGSIPLSNPVNVGQEAKKGAWAEAGDILMDGLAFTPLAELGAVKGMNGAFLAAKGGAGSELISLYRAVSQAEFDDIAENGLRVAPNGYQMGKLFATTAEDANEYGRLLQNLDEQVGKGRPEFHVIEVQVPNSVMEQSFRFQADGMNAVNVPAELLNQVKY